MLSQWEDASPFTIKGRPFLAAHCAALPTTPMPCICEIHSSTLILTSWQQVLGLQTLSSTRLQLNGLWLN